MSDPQPLDDLLARLERERQAADRAYNDALTALDRALPTAPALPEPPAAFDPATASADLANAPAAVPRAQGIRGLLWRLLGPAPNPQAPLHRQLAADIARIAAAHHELRQRYAELLEGSRREFAAIAGFGTSLIRYLQTITLYVDSKDRSFGGAELRDRLSLAEQRLALLKREVESGGNAAHQAADAAAGPPPSSTSAAGAVDSTTYVGFEDRFRGARADIARRVADYIPLLASASDVVDIGCGRGELLDLLKSHGVSARGVDANAAMVALGRARGLAVEQGDALGFLQRQADGSIGGLTAIQVVEHFEPGYLARFLETAFHKMRPGAPLILETINPACWMAFFETYIRDLTHQRPLHPDTLKYLVEASGFKHADVQFRQEVTEGDRLDRVAVACSGMPEAPSAMLAEIAAAVNAHADKLNARLFSSMDYVVVARR